MDAIGKMNTRLTVQGFTVARDAEGGEVKTWTDRFITYAGAEFMPVGSDEKFTSDQITTRTSVRFTIRKGDREISTKERLVYDGKIYEIDSVLPIGMRQVYLLIEAFQIGENKTI
jgi:SPP1 family predicted phage head-tail adaptor